MDKKIVLGFKELVNKGKENGKVLPASEAFKRYPPEKEWHKGKLENMVKGVNK